MCVRRAHARPNEELEKKNGGNNGVGGGEQAGGICDRERGVNLLQIAIFTVLDLSQA